jgi:iron complex outermembrane receptor protein
MRLFTPQTFSFVQRPLTLAAAVFVLSPIAIAQDLVLEEVTVTAKKTEVTLQDAAIAVSVTTGDDFDASNIMKLDNFNGYVPGLVVAKNDGAGRVVTIRGVGWETSQNLASQPSVLTYVDGIYLANPLSMGLDLGEVERVEVFRGPQGTEFGQGTTGGAINLVSKRPTLGEMGGYVDLGYGNYNNCDGQRRH